MIGQQKHQIQASDPQACDKPSALANIGDIYHIKCIGIIQVVDKDILNDGRVWLLIEFNSGAANIEWIVEPEPE